MPAIHRAWEVESFIALDVANLNRRVLHLNIGNTGTDSRPPYLAAQEKSHGESPRHHHHHYGKVL